MTENLENRGAKAKTRRAGGKRHSRSFLPSSSLPWLGTEIQDLDKSETCWGDRQRSFEQERTHQGQTLSADRVGETEDKLRQAAHGFQL